MSIKQLKFLSNPSLFFIDEIEKAKTLRFFPYEDKLPLASSPQMIKKPYDNQIKSSLSGISASQQLSIQDIENLFQILDTKKIYYVDLREESHFFINKDIPVSLTNKNNNPNQSKSLSQIEEEELMQLLIKLR